MAEELVNVQESQDNSKALIALTKKEGGQKILVGSMEGYTEDYNVDGIYVTDGEHSLILSLGELNCPWGGNSIDLSENDPLYNAAVASLQVYDGEWLTDFLINILSLGEGTACVEAKKIGWLPAGGEWTMIMAQKEAVNTLLEVVGGTKIEAADYWTSSKYSDERAYSYNIERGVFNLRKGNVDSLAVRPVKSSDGYTEV